ncbi:hypothetical protein BpHYR1_045923 [Brachionus plicatilis]|uniref:Uncharacterized protein n=1 Tax=Brachionus plicatilis TaxID=10195 RepID=A0A3M7PIK9_BRAPC|nr:hypothetical protein BpHYR1_045923 [Brachionus plicatilis]
MSVLGRFFDRPSSCQQSQISLHYRIFSKIFHPDLILNQELHYSTENNKLDEFLVSKKELHRFWLISNNFLNLLYSKLFIKNGLKNKVSKKIDLKIIKLQLFCLSA